MEVAKNDNHQNITIERTKTRFSYCWREFQRSFQCRWYTFREI